MSARRSSSDRSRRNGMGTPFRRAPGELPAVRRMPAPMSPGRGSMKG